jgi:nitrous oxidase accessory protein
MMLSDARLGAELVTTKGRVYYFDSPVCLAGFYAAGRVRAGDVDSMWVSDFFKPGRLLRVTKALFVKAERLHAGMGRVLAVSDAAELAEAKQTYGGTEVSWQDVVAAARRTSQAGGRRAPALAPSQRAVSGLGAGNGKSRGELVVCPSCPVSSLREAIAKAADGSRIIVRGGVYREGRIIIDKKLDLAGEGWPVVDGGGKFQVITVRADGVRIRGFVVRHSGTGALGDPAGIKVEGARGCVIENNRVLDDLFGIYLSAASDCIVRDNEVRGHTVSESFGGNAIHLWNCRHVTVENNRVSGYRDGLYFEFMHQSTVVGNLSERNLRYGMHTMYSADNSYRNNTLRDNQAGEVLMYSRRLVVTGNRIEHNWGSACDGALLKDLDQSRLEGNLFIRNSVGLYAENSNHNTIEDNEFLNNGIAARVLADSDGNLFRENAFDANTFDVATNSTVTSGNTFIRNYWSAYRGYDLNGDGIGDVPYRPVALFMVLVENYPCAIILLRSPFAELLDVAERAIPVLTPKALADNQPLMRRPSWSKSASFERVSAR